ncbi:MAG TPA: HNH endonuclease [bacterium]|jgi:5-methylcytosine-specific restriction endonuclease McrA
MSLSNGHVLVLNLDYQPINICGTRRAVKLLFKGKAEIIENRGDFIRSAAFSMPRPSVIKLATFIKMPAPTLKLSRKAILARDNHRCQYCGGNSVKMTVDHIVPRKFGGRFTWENLVCACSRCNAKKGDRTPADSEMKLLRPPRRPGYIPHISYSLYRQSLQEQDWLKYLPKQLTS